MDLTTAQAIFGALEALRYEDPGYDDGRESDEPILNVRLDAYTNRSDDTRAYRVRVTLGGGITEVTAWAWQQVLNQAEPHGLSVAVQNDGIELT